MTGEEQGRGAGKDTAADRIGYRHIVGTFAPYFNSVVESELADLRVPGASNQTTCSARGADVIQQIANPPDEVTGRAFTSLARDDVEAFAQVGGGLPMLHHIQALEKKLDRPIIAANIAPYWQALRAAGLHDQIAHAGRLFEERK